MSGFSSAVKSTIRQTIAGLYDWSAIHRYRHRGKVLVLAYHRVLSHEVLRRQWVQPGMYVLADVFDQQMECVRRHFHVLGFPELLERWRTKDWDQAQRYCVITFDDGWLDNYVSAFPVLKRYGIPATIFLPTDYIGTNQWFWPDKLCYLMKCARCEGGRAGEGAAVRAVLQRIPGIDENQCNVVMSAKPDMADEICDEVIERCKQLPLETVTRLIDSLAEALEATVPNERVIMNWDEVAHMSRNGITFGSHSCSHRILTTLTRPEIEMELENSKKALVERQVNYVPVFCYPNGNTTADIQRLVEGSGYVAATGVRAGVEGACPYNQFEISRVMIHNDVTHTVPLFLLRTLEPLL